MFVGGTGVLTFGGTVEARDGTQRFLVAAEENATSRIEAEGFDVAHQLADGRVLIVNGDESRQEDLADIRGVTQAIPDFRLELDTVEESLTPEPTAGQIGATADTAAADTPSHFDRQWPMQVTDVLDAHETATGDGVRVAIVDTGIHPDHVDLVGNVDEEASVAFNRAGERNDHEDEPIDGAGHGTAVGGAVAAHGANAALGVAPDAELVSVRTFEEGTLSTTGAATLSGWNYVAEIDVDVMNFSVASLALHPIANEGGDRGILEELANYLVRSGTLISTVTGNEGVDLQHGPSVKAYSDMAGTMGSSSTSPLDDLAFYSNYGKPSVSVGAPGGGHDDVIMSVCGVHEWFAAISDPDRSDDAFFEAHVDVGEETHVCFGEDGFLIRESDPDPEDDGVTCIPCVAPEYPFPLNWFFHLAFDPARPEVNNLYNWNIGTSFAAPVTTGVAALVIEANPDLNPRQVERAIKDGAELVEGEGDLEIGAGRVNAANSVEEAR